MNFDQVKDALIAEAERLDLADYEVYFMKSSGISTETLKDEISSFSFGVGGGVGFRCIVDGHMGHASTELLTQEEMRSVVRRAMENAKYIENADKAILYAGADRYETVALPEVILPQAAELKQIALAMQGETYAQSEHVTDGTQSGVFSEEIQMELMNSHGLRLSNCVAMSGAFVQAVIQKDGESEEAFDFCLGLDAADRRELSHRTVIEACSKLGAGEISSGKYDVILSGKQMRALLSAFSSVFSAKQAQLGLSLLAGKEGQAVAAPSVTLIDDPMREGCPMQTPFDGEGVATYKKLVIENGRLNTLLYDLATADRAGVTSTGNGQRVGFSAQPHIAPYSFYLSAGDRSSEELKAILGDGLYITELKGLHAGCNGATGDFSLESAGYLVKDGKLGRAVKSFTVAGNFFELLCRIEALSDCVNFGIPSGFTVFGAPDVLLRQMSIAGK